MRISNRDKIIFLSSLFFAWSLIFVPPVVAKPKSGTLPDGRPFRTDAEGNQLIDYVAELESSVTYLKDRVGQLEQELDTSKQALVRFKEGEGCEEPRALPEAKLFERDLGIEAHPRTTAVVPGLTKGDSFEVKKPEANGTRLAATEVRPAPRALDLVDIARKQAEKSISSTRELLNERAKLFKSYIEIQEKKPISFSLSNPVSKKGHTLDQIAAAVKNSKRDREINYLGEEVRQIDKILKDDIALIKRVSKIKKEA